MAIGTSPDMQHDLTGHGMTHGGCCRQRDILSHRPRIYLNIMTAIQSKKASLSTVVVVIATMRRILQAQREWATVEAEPRSRLH